MEIIEIGINLFYVYLLAGGVFAVLFLWRGAAAIDDAAKGISWKTKLMLFPGMLALWPVLLKKWLSATKKTNQEHDTHAA